MEKNSRHDEAPEEYSPPAMPIAPDGGIDGGMIGQPAAIPPRTAEHFVCLRGPCRHYWHLVTMAQEGNPADTWKALGIDAPRQHHHTCLVNPGWETSIEDDNVFECSKWDPLTDHDLIQLKTRREEYFERHPDHRPEENDG